MSSENNNGAAKSNMPEPTMLDLFNLIQTNASKQAMEEIKSCIENFKADTNEKIDVIDQKVIAMSSLTNENASKIELLESNIEMLKQEQLKNNVCISGVPSGFIKDDNTADIIVEIAKNLEVDINKGQFSSYAVANNKFIIVQFYMHKHKLSILRKIRTKKSLLVEEVFTTQCNSQIYINDHLTPHFNRLHLMARRAKKDGKLVSASSIGGKLRVRKHANDAPISITNEKQLQSLIDIEYDDNSSDSLQFVDVQSNISHSTQSSTIAQHTRYASNKTCLADNTEINATEHKQSHKRKANDPKKPPKKLKT